MRTVRAALTLLLLCAPAAPRVAAQQQQQGPPPAVPDEDARRGDELYRRGDTKGAAKAFRAALKRHKEDPVLWLNLAQALLHRGQLVDARQAIDEALRLAPGMAAAHASLGYLNLISGKITAAESESRRALELDPRSIDAHYVLGLIRLREGAWLKALAAADAIIKINDAAPVAHVIRGEALLGLYERGQAVLGDERRGAYDFGDETVAAARAAQPRRMREAIASFETYLRLRPDAPDADVMREQLEGLRTYVSDGPDGGPKIYSTGETTTKAIITAKPEPSFTEEARKARVNGIVRLRAVLGADGRVRGVYVLRRLDFGLTGKAVAAARGIKFRPATLNGVPVPVWVTLEYNFNVY